MKTVSSEPRIIELGLTLPMTGDSPYEQLHFRKSYPLTHEDERWRNFPNRASFAKELVEMDIHSVTHIDAFNHRAERGIGYQGNRYLAPENYMHGADAIPTIKGQGILFDIPRLLGVDKLALDKEISSDLLKKYLHEQGQVELSGTDIALIRTGHIALWKSGKFDEYFDKCPGLTTEAANWLVDRGVKAIGADNFAIERIPTPQHGKTEFFPLHKLCLIDKGIYLIENLDLDELAASKSYSFLFIAAPIRIGNASAAFVNPLAII